MKIDSVIIVKNDVAQIAAANSAEIMAALIEDGNPHSGLARAALLLKNHPNVFNQLVSDFKRFDQIAPASAHMTLFYTAIYQQNSDFVNKFVGAIAKETLIKFLNFHDDCGWSGLHVLLAYQQAGAINIAWDSRSTPLHAD